MIREIEQKDLLNTIKDELKNYVGIKTYRCPLCEKTFEWDDANYYPEDNTYTCPCCRTTIDEVDLLEVNVCELFEDMFIAYKEKNRIYKEIKNERN